MPRDETAVVGIFEKKSAGPAQNVRTGDILDGIQNRGMSHEPIHPRQQKMRLVVHMPRPRSAMLRFKRF